jgi:maleylpyruvate isomerase
MPDQNSQAIVEELLPEATRRLIRTADDLAYEEYPEPSGLPDWTRAHVLAHLALNAEGLAGALGGIVEGERTPMYASQEARDGDIAEDQWDTTIDRVPGGRTFTAGDVPGMRLREVEIHHADLAAGYHHRSWPPEFAVLLVDGLRDKDVSTDSFRARATDLDRAWSFGEGGPTVSGTGADLGWWLTGRGTGEGLTSDSGTLPQIGAW